MSDKKIVKPLALAVGIALAGSFAIGGTVNADSLESPFEMSTLPVGYMLGEGEGSCGEGSCGGDDAEGEGSCGGDGAEGEGSCGGDSDCDDDADADADTDGEGSCGEGSCGGSV